jgi:hypothetical protein
MDSQRVCLKFAVALTILLALTLIPMTAAAQQTWTPRDASGKVLKLTPDSFYSYDDISKHFDIRGRAKITSDLVQPGRFQ